MNTACMINHVDHVEQVEGLKALASEVGQIAYGDHEYFGTGLLEKGYVRKVCGWHMGGENYCGNLLWQSCLTLLAPNGGTQQPPRHCYPTIGV